MKNSKNRNLRIKFTFIVIWLAAGYLSNAQAQTGITFGATAYSAVGTAPAAAVTGDFNGDGKLDAAVANFDSGDVSILLGDGAGGFAPAINVAVDAAPTALAAGDFNKDGKLDLVTAHYDSGIIRLRVGDGAGGFTALVNSLATAPTPRALAVGDFNGDGNLDVISANDAANSVRVFRGGGTGGFTGGTTFNISAAPFSITTGDFNYDGNLDYATANPATDNVSVGLGIAGGGFSTAVAFNVGDSPQAVATGDFDRDGKLDLVVSLDTFLGGISLLKGNGSGGFSAPATFSALRAAAILTGDFNNDGKLDVATSNNNNGGTGFSVTPGDGAGGFSSGGGFGTGFVTRSLANGDFNNDGKLDVISVDGTGNRIALNLNTTITATCSTTGFSVGTAFPTDFNPGGIATADFDRDGILDFAVASDNTLNNLAVVRGIGNGQFLSATRYMTGGMSYDVAAGDFNRDGNVDLATANYNTNNVSILLNNGFGGFPSVVNINIGDGVVKIIAEDFNKDGKLDLATLNGLSPDSSTNITILIGNGGGGFPTLTNFLTGDSNIAEDFAAGDFNRDGNLDLVVISDSTRMAFLPGDGAGGFGPPVVSTVNTSNYRANALTSGDFNRDGKLDIAVTSKNGGPVYVRLGNGDGSFTPAQGIDTGSYISTSIVTGDFNNDGKSDLAVASLTFEDFDENALAFTILRGNGAGNFAPAFTYRLRGFGATALAPGDFNRDGKTDILSSLYQTNANSLGLNSCVDNTAPVAVNDSYGGRQATTLNVPAPGVLANDTDLENNTPLTAILVSPPSQGTLTLNANGSFAYTPVGNFRGSVSFTYKVSDGRLESNTATVTLVINNPPIANNDSFTTAEDSGANTLPVLVNDTADQNETVSIVSVTQGANGAVAVSSNGSFVTYTPNANYFGADSFTYTIADSNGGLTATATVNMAVIEVNDPPTANDDSAEIPINSPAATIDVLANDTALPDPGETLRITAVTQSANGGTVVITNNGADLTYRPPTDFSGGDSFTYTITDSRGRTDTAVVTADVANTFTVTNNSDVDDGVCDTNCSLREAIAAAQSGDRITFDPAYFNVARTITLIQGKLLINRNLKISGPGADMLTVSGNNTTLVFHALSGTVVLSGMTISGGNSGDGGGIHNNAVLTVSRCHIKNNIAGRGSGIFNNDGTMTLLDSTVSDNTANNNNTSGGIASFGGSLIVDNSTISGNRTQNGNFNAGGIWTNFSATITNSTITGNEVGGASSAGGIYRTIRTISDSATVTIRNTIVAGNVNSVPDIVNAQFSGSRFISAGYNLIGNVGLVTTFNQPGDQTGGGGNPVIDVMLAPLADNGGLTFTHKPLTGSPVIDKGSSAAFSPFGFLIPPTIADQRGLLRPFDNPSIPNASGGNGADIGAFEVQAVPTAASVSVSGRVFTPDGRGLSNAFVHLTDQNGATRTTRTTTFGYYRFEEVQAGETYIFRVVSKRYSFAPQVVNVTEDLTELNFTAEPIGENNESIDR